MNPIHCQECGGGCCRKYCVPLTSADVKRIASAGFDPSQFVDSVDVASFACAHPDIRLTSGYHYLILARGDDGICVFADETPHGITCRIHGNHPIACRGFPQRDGICSHPLPDARLLSLRSREIKEYSEAVEKWNRDRICERSLESFISYLLGH